MVAKKLNQILAVEKTVKGKREDSFTKLYQNIQKADLVSGLVRTYQPKLDDGEKLPSESKRVQVNVEAAVQQTADLMREVFNITAAKDATNCVAVADIVVEGETLAKNVPATHLLWMEKKLLSFAEFITKLPTLSQDTVWTKDEGTGNYRSAASERIRTVKLETNEVVIAPTDKHPGQWTKMTRDIIMGTWTETHFSGAITEARKRQLQERVEKFMKAVKEARETANQTEIVDLATGNIVDRLFAP